MPRVLVAGDSMLKDQVGSFTLKPGVAVEVRSFSGIRIERLFFMIAGALPDFDVVVMHVGTNNTSDSAITRIARFRQLVSRILEVNPEIRIAFSAILPRQMSLRKNDRWAVSAEVLQEQNEEALETNFILQELCRREGHGFIDGASQEWNGMLRVDGVHFNKKGSEVFRHILRGGIQAVVASHQQEAEELHWKQDLVEMEHQELRRQYGDQASELAEFWGGKHNFPPMTCDVAGVPASSGEPHGCVRTVPAPDMSKGTTTWAMVVQRPPRRPSPEAPRMRNRGGASAPVEGAVVGCVPSTQHTPVAQSHVYPGPVAEHPVTTSVAESAPSTGGNASRKLRRRGARSSGMPVKHGAGRAPPLVGGVWVRQKASTPRGTSVRPTSSGGSVSVSGSRKGTPSTVVVQRPPRSLGVPRMRNQGGANAAARGVVGARVPSCTPSSAASWNTGPVTRAGQSTYPACHTQGGSDGWIVVRRRRRRKNASLVPLMPNHSHVRGVPTVGSCTDAHCERPSHGSNKKQNPCSGLPSPRAAMSVGGRHRLAGHCRPPVSRIHDNAGSACSRRQGPEVPPLQGDLALGVQYKRSSAPRRCMKRTGREPDATGGHVEHGKASGVGQHGSAMACSSLEATSKRRLTGGGLLSKGMTFDNFNDFFEVFKKWQEDGYHPMKVRRSDRNKLTQPGDPFRYSRITFTCVHEGMGCPRGKGIRRNQRFLGKNCPVRIQLTLSEKPHPHYEVREFVDIHLTHEVGPQFYMWYNCVRLLSDCEKEQITDLLFCKVKSKEIKEIVLKKTGKHLTSQDVRNLKHARVKKIENSVHHGSLLLEQMEDLASRCPGWTVHIEKNERDELLFVLLQSRLMQQFAEKYSEVLFFDGTYKVNIEGYVLHSILCEDSTGHGRPVCYAFVQRETSEILKSALAKFLALNPAVVSNCKVAVMDKDLNEMNILGQLLPGCQLLLCSWHVVKYLHLKVSQQSSSTLNKQAVKDIIQDLVYAHDENIYNAHLQKLESELKNAPQFLEYYRKNWHPCRRMWVHAYRRGILCFGNNTNNRMESHNQKIKQFLQAHMHLVEAVMSLVQYIEHEALSVSLAQFNENKVCVDTLKIDSFHLEVSRKCTVFARDLIYKQHELFCQDSTWSYSMRNGEHVINVQGSSYIVSQDLTRCRCTFHNQYKLPCRHIFAVRSALKIDLFDVKCVATRWLKSDFTEAFIDTTPATPQVITTSVANQGNPKLDTVEAKYKYAHNKLLEWSKSLANTLAQLSPKELQEKLMEIEAFFKNVTTFPRNKASQVIAQCNKGQDNGSEGNLEKGTLSEPESVTENLSNEETEQTEEMDPLILGQQHIREHNYFKATNIWPEDETSQAKELHYHDEINGPKAENNLDMAASNSTNVRGILSIPLNKAPRGRPRKRRARSQGAVTTNKNFRLITNVPCNTTSVHHVSKENTQTSADLSDGINAVQYVASLPPNSASHSLSKEDTQLTLGATNLSDIETKAKRYMEILPPLSHAARFMSDRDFMTLLLPTTLDDPVINTAQSILLDQFQVCGLQDTLLGQSNLFRRQDKFLQILHVPGHWVTVTNYGAPNNTVFLFDSLDESISPMVVSQLWNILGPDVKRVTIQARPVQAQENCYDCGLFAIANAYIVAAGRDPCLYNYDKHAMRAHLLRCICDGEILQFPTTTAYVPRVRPREQSFNRPPDESLNTRPISSVHYYHEEVL